VEKGVVRLVLNGETLEGNRIPASRLNAENDVTVTLG
jgi:hypothetical protein